jgi:hypothetical protein
MSGTPKSNLAAHSAQGTTMGNTPSAAIDPAENTKVRASGGALDAEGKLGQRREKNWPGKLCVN